VTGTGRARGAPAPRPWVKICGVTRPDDARLAAELGATFVGVNFWPRSPRCVELTAAAEIAASLGENSNRNSFSPALVGVFVNEAPERIEEIAETIGLDYVQLHGDEPGELVARFGSRALRGLRAEGIVGALLNDWASLDGERANDGAAAFDAALERSGLSLQWKAFALVLDSPRTGDRYGGTGAAWNWERARPLCKRSPTPILIAGGVTPESAGAALAASSAAGVDLASGVESAPGIKDREKMVRLFEGVRRGAR
jgi:phosphoribosylanthranilate isomerase